MLPRCWCSSSPSFTASLLLLKPQLKLLGGGKLSTLQLTCPEQKRNIVQYSRVG